MSLVSRLFRPRAGIGSSQELDEVLNGGRRFQTDSGAVVTAESAMMVADVYAAVRVLAETVAQVPLLSYRRTADGRDRAVDHWLYRLLDETPNPWQTAFEWKEMMQAHVALCGNAYSLKTVVKGEVRELLPVSPARVKVRQLQPSLVVVYDLDMPSGETKTVPAERMFHLPGLAFNGLTGLSPVQYQRESFGLAMQLRQHGARLFKNGASPRIILTHPNVMGDEAYKRLKDSFDEEYAGVSNAHKTMLLEEGTTVAKSPIMSSEDAQFLESRKYSRNEIATVFRLPPHMLGDMERATFSNIEQQALEFLAYSMGPWFRRWEQRVTMQLIPEDERATLYAEFLPEALLRGDAQARGAFYQQMVQIGVMSPNEVRQKENLPRRTDAGGDTYVDPAFLTGKQPAPAPVPA